MKSHLENFRLETENLILVPITMEYADDIFSVFDDEITKYMYPSAPKTVEDTKTFIRGSMDKIAKGEEIVAAILNKETHEYFGNIGLHTLCTRTPEFGIWIKNPPKGTVMEKKR